MLSHLKDFLQSRLVFSPYLCLSLTHFHSPVSFSHLLSKLTNEEDKEQGGGVAAEGAGGGGGGGGEIQR